MDWPGTDLGPPRCQANDWPPEPWQNAGQVAIAKFHYGISKISQVTSCQLGQGVLLARHLSGYDVRLTSESWLRCNLELPVILFLFNHKLRHRM